MKAKAKKTEFIPPPAVLPPLADFLRWAAEMPAGFKAEPQREAGEGVSVRACVHDLFETLCGKRPEEEFLRAFTPSNTGLTASDVRARVESNRLRWVLAACHVLWHPTLRSHPPVAENLRKLLIQDLSAIAAIVPANHFVTDEERREELIRRALEAAGLRLPGESPVEAKDRLAQIDSIERQRVISEAAAKEKRARQVREEMARKAAEEAAAKVSRE